MVSFNGLAKKLMPHDLRHFSTLKTGTHHPWLLFVAFYALLANLPYWFVSHEFGFIPLGLFCDQYLIIGILALFIPRFISALLLFVVILADLLCGICFTYSLPIRESLENLGVAHSLSWARIAFAFAAILLTCLVAAVSAFLPGKALAKRHRWYAATCLLAFVALAAGTDVVVVNLATGSVPVMLRRSKVTDGLDLSLSRVPRLARIPVIRLVRMEVADAALRKTESNDARYALNVPSASEVALRESRILSDGSQKELPNLVLVVVESWGSATDRQLKNSLVQPYLQEDLQARYEVIQGSVPFHGPTVPGEARELCGKSLGYHLINAQPSELQGCLPDQLAARGYNTLAVHGMSGNMFARLDWYGTIGFHEMWFHDQLRHEGLGDCAGAFIGTCDGDIADWIGRRLAKDSTHPYFIHWMTLNSHLPVLVPSPLSDPAPCQANLSLTPNTPLCSWYQLIVNVHQSVADLATSNLARPTIFVVVGDHAPPFGDPALHDRFSQSEVPYVVLLPRASLTPSRAALAHVSASLANGSTKRSLQNP